MPANAVLYAVWFAGDAQDTPNFCSTSDGSVLVFDTKDRAEDACQEFVAQRGKAYRVLEYHRGTQAQVADWQPISTAPKDGTFILACKGPPEGTLLPAYGPDSLVVSWRHYFRNSKDPTELGWRDTVTGKKWECLWWRPLS